MKRRKTCGLQLQPSILCIEVGSGKGKNKRVGGSTSFSKQEVKKIEKHETIKHARKIIL
jgi:hypothetical protein